MAVLGTLVVTLGVDYKEFSRGLHRATASMNNFAQRARTFGYLTSVTVTAPMVAAGKQAVELASDYEYSMQKIVGLVGETQEAVDEFGVHLERVGKEFGKGPREMAEAMYFVTSSGVQGSQALDVVEQSAKAAAAGLGETQAVADLVTSALNAYADAGLTSTKILDQLVAAIKYGKIESDEFAQSVGQVIPLASEMGIEFGQVVGAMAAMSLTGSNAAKAATYLRGIMNSLWKESEKGTDAMAEASAALGEMGMSYADLRRIVEQEGLVALLEKLRELSEEYGDTLMSKVFPNIRGLTGVLSIAGKNFEYNSKIMEKIENSTGALGEAWAAVADTVKIRLNKAISSLQFSLVKLGTTIGLEVIPIITTLVNKVIAMIDKFDQLSESQKRNRLRWLAVAAAAGPLALLVSTVIYALSGLLGVIGKVSYALVWLGKNIAGVQIKTLATGASRAAVAISTLSAGLAGLGIAAVGVVIGMMINDLVKLRKEAERTAKVIEGLFSYEWGAHGEDISPVSPIMMSIAERYKKLEQLSKSQLNTLISDISMEIGLRRARLNEIRKMKAEELMLEEKAAEAIKLIQEKRERYLELAATRQYGAFFRLMTADFRGAWQEMLASKEMKQIEKQVPDLLKGLQSHFESRMREIKLEMMVLPSSLETLNTWYDEVQKTLTAFIESVYGANGGLKDQDDLLKKIWADFDIGEDRIDGLVELYERLGMVYDENRARADLYMSTLEEIAAIGALDKKRSIELMEALKELKKEMYLAAREAEYATTQYERFGEILTTIWKREDRVAGRPIEVDVKPRVDYGKWVKEFSLSWEKAMLRGPDIFGKRLEKDFELIEEYGKAIGKSYDVYNEKLRVTRMLLDFVRESATFTFEEKIKLLKKLGDEYDKILKDLEEIAKEERIFRAIGQAVAGVADRAGEAMADMSVGFEGVVESIVGGLKRIIKALLVETMIAILSGQAKKFGLAGALFAATVGLSMLQTVMRKSERAGSRTELARGGIVPPGYPNDTYPAFLSSNEAVIPLDRLDKAFFGGGEVRFEIEGDRLVGILRKQEKKSSIY